MEILRSLETERPMGSMTGTPRRTDLGLLKD
jgi:hypothetical protein